MGKAHSPLGGSGGMPPPENFENLHCLRLILRQSGRYFRHCSLEFLDYNFDCPHTIIQLLTSFTNLVQSTTRSAEVSYYWG